MKTSETIANLAAALAAAQAEIRAAEEDAKALVQSDKAKYSYGYATLASVWDACRGPLSKNGLSVIQSPETTFAAFAADDRGQQKFIPPTVRVTTRLMHKSGEWMESDITLRPDGDTPQKIGSAITYGRRYALSAMVGVAPDDDDGSDASGVPTSFEQRGQRQQPPAQKPAPTQSPAAQPGPPSPTPCNELAWLLRDECGCKSKTDALAVLRFVLGDEWSKLPLDCSQEEAKDVIARMRKFASERGPLASVLEQAMTPS